MILEGIVTTTEAGGAINISPMGPLVDSSVTRLRLRPYQTSRTYQNLKRSGQGVFHVTDNVELIAQAAVGTPDPLPATHAGPHGGLVLDEACRWYEFRVSHLDDSQPRTEIDCEVVACGVQREFFGFNRAKHAVLEAAILATRVEFLPAEEIRAEFRRLRVPVDKTGGPVEVRAFEFLSQYVAHRLPSLTS